MDSWDEIQTAFHVARVGTVSGAAEVLGIHHSTVIRHVESLEKRLGTKLFQRHRRGYETTEAGQQLLTFAQAVADQLAHLAARIESAANDYSGELIVTTVPGLAHLVLPTLARLRNAHPELRLRYVSDMRLFRLEYGEAHVAIRAGRRPQELDNVVQFLCGYPIALYASKGYVQKNGAPKEGDDSSLTGHTFIGQSDAESRAPFYRWLENHAPPDAIVLRTNDPEAVLEAVVLGVGLGCVSALKASNRHDLVQVMAPRVEWNIPLWLVTHVDLHRTRRVQLFVRAIKDAARAFGMSHALAADPPPATPKIELSNAS